MKYNYNTMNGIAAAMIAAVLFISLAFSFVQYRNVDLNQYDNEVRVLIEKQKDQIIKGLESEIAYPYLRYDLEGKVIASGGELPFDRVVVNVQEMLQFDKSFAKTHSNQQKISFVIEKEGRVTGFITFIVPSEVFSHLTIKEGSWQVFSPMLAGILLCVFLLVGKTMYTSRFIFRPIREINRSAKAIISGNYDLEVLRTYGCDIGKNEVGDLSYSFELMRDELKAKQIKEEALKKSQQELISCISHDLKTPISTIKAYTEGLRDGIVKTEEGRAEYVSIILKKTDLLITMISELLEYSNIQLKQLDIKREERYILSYLQPLMNELFHYVKMNHISFSHELIKDDVLIYMDQRRITEVLYNLIENSMKYVSKKDGEIKLKVSINGTYLLFQVVDNGIGIQSDDIPYVFDKFYRAEKSRSSSIAGSGLGLSICQYIIQEHGGEIYCKSKKDVGCEIGFYLPI